MKIVLARIDDRLIHGQVVTRWIQYSRAKNVLIIDDEVPNNSFLKQVITLSIPPKINIFIKSISEAIEFIHSNKTNDSFMLLFKYPDTVLKLLNSGVDIPELNLGGVGAHERRKKFYRNISLSKQEIETLRTISERGSKIFIKSIPEDKDISFQTLIQDN
ncbi:MULTISPECIES: PTS system mannose/fructose/N-acetylgalactosamine-transporter subunit IIB [Enterococcus]|uniref:PTS system, mannose-specific IIB component n=1 Tax=Candidatus Enterococcus ferrettii TaxID=2815324 RepID=A0ABV0EW74_9ENTE|nr:PTS sugar transporter subunit IIB [Enterococcus sp. 665A]MBO1340144.1 PTS sugar transporter subunit IIB [Enterococcus sp. 665A]